MFIIDYSKIICSVGKSIRSNGPDILWEYLLPGSHDDGVYIGDAVVMGRITVPATLSLIQNESRWISKFFRLEILSREAASTWEKAVY